MSKVFLISEPSGAPRDFTSANRYGQIVPLLGQEAKASYAPGPALRQYRKLVLDINPEDYITFAGGDPITPFLAGIAIGENAHLFKEMNWLRWERALAEGGQRVEKAGYYVPVQFALR